MESVVQALELEYNIFFKKEEKKKKRETGDDVWMLHTFSKSAHPQGPYMVQR